MKKFIIIAILSIFSLCSLSACGSHDKAQTSKSKEETQQLSPKAKKKENESSKNDSVQTAPKSSEASTENSESRASDTDPNSTESQEQQNKDLVKKFFSDYLVYDTSKTPAYQRASEMLSMSNNNVVNYLMPNVLGNGNSVSESMNFTQAYISPIIINSSSQAQYQYDVTVEYKTVIGNSSNQTKELYSLTVERGKINVIRKDKTWLWDVTSKAYQ